MKNRIEKGDRVRISFTTDEALMEGVVDCTPQATGDSWVIIHDDGGVCYVQMFETMQLVSQPNAGIDRQEEVT